MLVLFNSLCFVFLVQRLIVIASSSRRRRVVVVNVMARLFMDPLDDPFAAVDSVLATQRLGAGVDAILVDVIGSGPPAQQFFTTVEASEIND